MTPEEASDADEYWRCNVCGEDAREETAVELLVWNVIEADGSGMKYEPDESPATYEDEGWQGISGTVVHFRCLLAQFEASRAQADYFRRTTEGS